MEHSEPKISGYLFESISYPSNEGLESFIENLNLEQSLYVIQEAINLAYTRNAYTLTESEILSKSLRIINKNLLSDEPKNQS